MIEVQFGDCDPAGIVFYPNYFRWSDVGFSRLIASAGLGRQVIQRFPLVEAGAKFRKPTSVGDMLSVNSSISSVNNRSIEVSHQFFVGEQLAVAGWEVRVWRSEAKENLVVDALPADIVSRLHNRS